MKAFTRLFNALDATTRTSVKVAALEEYFRAAAPADAAWALHFLAGNRIKRLVKTTALRQWAAEASGFPMWLVEECYDTVGDLAETLALLLTTGERAETTAAVPLPLHELIEKRLLPLAQMDEPRQRDVLLSAWAQFGARERLVWNKLITGAFRVGVSRTLLVRALAAIAQVPPPVMEHRLMGDWQPTPEHYLRLLSSEGDGPQPARPYPFYLASPLEGGASELGEAHDWQFEWKWDGIRAQIIRRAGECVIWSRGEEIITPGFPEVAEAAALLPEGMVLDGELLAWRENGPLPFAQLQRRLNRREAAARLRAEVPMVFMAYDLLERDGEDWRARPLAERRTALEVIVAAAVEAFSHRTVREAAPQQGELFAEAEVSSEPVRGPMPCPLRVSPLLPADDWSVLGGYQQQARESGTEGLMLKLRNSPYGTGRQRGAWWKWKVAPFTCDAVLVAAQPGHGRRATLFTDYTFAVWENGELVPVAKAYSGLTDEEIDEVDAFVRANTTGRFGPVRSVKAELVFELAFEGIQKSTRHRSGLALRFPRMARWRRDKRPEEADAGEMLRQLMG
jgi:DNA ligase-1